MVAMSCWILTTHWIAMSLQECMESIYAFTRWLDQNGWKGLRSRRDGGDIGSQIYAIPGETWLHRARGRIAVVRRLQGRCLRADFAGAPTWYGQELAVGSCGYPAGTFSCHVSSLQLVVLDSDQYSHFQSLPRP